HCKGAVLVRLLEKATATPAGNVTVDQFTRVWPTGAWLIRRIPFVTCSDSGAKSSENDRSVASTPNHDRPAVLVTCTNCNVPEPLTAPDGTPPDSCRRNARPVAPAPAKVRLEASNWSSSNLTLIVNNPTTSIAALPSTCKATVLVRLLEKATATPAGNVTVDQFTRDWATGAWLMRNTPFVTASDNGAKSSENDRSVASTPSHDKPAVLVTCTNCNVPEPLTAPDGTPPESCRRNASPVAPAPAKVRLEASN